MSEFQNLMLESLLPRLINSNLIYIVIASLFPYFGYFYTRHTVKIESYSKNFLGMFYLFYYLGLSLYLVYFTIQYFPRSWFIIESEFYSTLLKIITITYSSIIAWLAIMKSMRCETKFSYDEVDPIIKEFLKSNDRNNKPLNPIMVVISRVFENTFRLLNENKRFLLAAVIYIVFFIGLRSYILFIFGYMILISKTSIPTGIFIYLHIFLALTLIALEKGITKDSFRYGEIYLKNPKKSITGRIKRIDSNSVQILKKRKDGTTYLVDVPLNNVSRIELRTLDEIT